jgi:hypothetical protein
MPRLEGGYNVPLLKNVPENTSQPTITFPDSLNVSGANTPLPREPLQLRSSGESSGGSLASTEPPSISETPIASRPTTRRPSVDLTVQGLDLQALLAPPVAEKTSGLTTEQARELTVKKKGMSDAQKKKIAESRKILGIIKEEGPTAGVDVAYEGLGGLPFSQLEKQYEEESAKESRLGTKTDDASISAYLLASSRREALNRKLLEESEKIERDVSGTLEDILGRVVAKEEEKMNKERLGMAEEEARTRLFMEAQERAEFNPKYTDPDTGEEMEVSYDELKDIDREIESNERAEMAKEEGDAPNVKRKTRLFNAPPSPPPTDELSDEAKARIEKIARIDELRIEQGLLKPPPKVKKSKGGGGGGASK